MPSASFAGRSLSSLAWTFKFPEFCVLGINCINWIWAKHKLIFEEWIYLRAYECVIIQFVWVFHYTTSLHIVFCFSIPAFCLERKNFVVFKMCQEILTRSVLLSPMGQILRPSSCCIVSQENNNFGLHKFFEDNFLGNRKPFLCLRYCLFVLVMLKVPTDTSENKVWASNSKGQTF
jgi:hypothetical protein